MANPSRAAAQTGPPPGCTNIVLTSAATAAAGLSASRSSNSGSSPVRTARSAYRNIAADQAFPGISTTAGPVDVAALLGGKDRLVDSMRTSKYVSLAADYDWPILTGTARFAADPGGPAP